MAEDGRYAVATMVLSGRAQTVLIRPIDKLLAITVLSYDTQLKKPADFESEVPDVPTGAAEVKFVVHADRDIDGRSIRLWEVSRRIH